MLILCPPFCTPPCFTFSRFGFVYFAEPEAVQTVISDPSLVEELGPSIGVQKLEPPKNNNRSSTTRPRNEESESVFFAGFPPSMLKSDVEAAVSQFYPSSGVIDEVFLPMNRIERMEEDENFPSHDGPRHNKGYAFVRFTNKEDAREFLDKFTQAVQEEGFKFEGSRFPPTANYAKPRTQEASDGRPGGRPSRGGRGGGARAWIDEERGRYSSRGDDFRM